MCVPVHACVHVCACAHMSPYECASTPVHVCACARVCACVCPCTRVPEWASTPVHVCRHMCVRSQAGVGGSQGSRAAYHGSAVFFCPIFPINALHEGCGSPTGQGLFLISTQITWESGLHLSFPSSLHVPLPSLPLLPLVSFFGHRAPLSGWRQDLLSGEPREDCL